MIAPRALALGILSWIIVALAGCGGGGLPSFDYISITPDDFAARPGDNIQFLTTLLPGRVTISSSEPMGAITTIRRGAI